VGHGDEAYDAATLFRLLAIGEERIGAIRVADGETRW
jgi:hypothetical protein